MNQVAQQQTNIKPLKSNSPPPKEKKKIYRLQDFWLKEVLPPGLDFSSARPDFSSAKLDFSSTFLPFY